MEKIERGQFIDFNDKNSQIQRQSIFIDKRDTIKMFFSFQIAKKKID
jgi:hypothetical protein